MSSLGHPGAGLIGNGSARPADLFSAVDLLDGIDEHTRRLLERQRRAHRGWLVRRSLLVADVVGLTSAFMLAALIYGGHARGGPLAQKELLLFAMMLPCWVVVAKLHGLYDRDEQLADHSTTDDMVGVFHLVTIGTWLLIVSSYTTRLADPDLPKVIAFWVLAVCLVPLGRLVAREASRRSVAYQQNTVIVGAGDVGQLIARKLIKHPEYGLNVIGFVDATPKARRADLPGHLTVLGRPARLPEIIERLDVERVVIAFSLESTEELLELVRSLRSRNVQIDVVPRLYELVGPRVAVHTVEGLPLLGLPPLRVTRTARLIKRTMDVVGASLGLLVTAPLFAYIALRIRRDSPGPVFFRQVRLGTGSSEFTALKFRTMKVDTDTSVHREYISGMMSTQAVAEGGASGIYKLDRADAVTNVGRWLRKTSLDELPQLLNVLKGEMSLVGPRPCIPYELEHFRPHHLERFLVPQGITGLWQVTARANATFGEALDMDVAYVRGWSLGLDLRLFARTPLALLHQRTSTA